MGDTPRTDAAEKLLAAIWGGSGKVHVSVARQLERESASKDARIAELTAELAAAQDKFDRQNDETGSVMLYVETLQAESARRLAVIVELVACKDLKDKATRLGNIPPPDFPMFVDSMLAEYDRRKPLAWSAARAEVEAAKAALPKDANG